MFPPRPNFLALRKQAKNLALGEVFGPPPGPADVTGSSSMCAAPLPKAGTTGYGDMPYGDTSDGEHTGLIGEDPSLVGYVIQQTQYNFVAQRTQTWGGTTIITSKFDDARKFIEAACGLSLRQEKTELESGPLMFKFYNSVYEATAAQAAQGGYGD